MSAQVVSFPRAGTPLLRRDQELLAGLDEIQQRLDQVLRYLRAGDYGAAQALVMIANLEVAEVEGLVLGRSV